MLEGLMRMLWLALVGMLCACAASTPAVEDGWSDAGHANECEDAGEDPCLAPACTEEFCALYRCEDLTPGQVVRTRGSLPVRPPPDSQRYWGNAQVVPGSAQPVMVFHWYRPEELPSQKETRRILEAWKQRPKERHHIFPRAFEDHFKSRRINIHQWVLLLDVAEHKRIHHGPDGGPWNKEWREWIAESRGIAPVEKYFEQASMMIQRYNLWGLPGTYWQRFALPPSPPRD